MTPEQLLRRAGDERTEYEVQLAAANQEIARLRARVAELEDELGDAKAECSDLNYEVRTGRTKRVGK